MRLAEYLPGFSAELSKALHDAGHLDLGQSFAESEIVEFKHDSSCGASYIYLQPVRQLNAIEANIVEARHGETISIEHPFWVHIDIDNFRRPMGIELLSASSLFVQKMMAYERI